METKKAWEFLLLAHPCCQALALPPVKDKQRSQPTPSDYIYSNPYINIGKRWDIIHPRRRLPLHYLCDWIQICEIWQHRTITSVNAFPVGLPYKWHCWPLDSTMYWPALPQTAGLVGANIAIIPDKTKKKRKIIFISLYTNEYRASVLSFLFINPTQPVLHCLLAQCNRRKEHFRFRLQGSSNKISDCQSFSNGVPCIVGVRTTLEIVHTIK